MKKKCFLIVSFILCIISVCAQLNIGEWEVYSSFQNPTKIIETPQKVYILADNFLYSYDKDDQQIQTHSKKNGLSDMDIKEIAYNIDDDYLVIAYSNSNIDILKNNSIYNIPDLKEKILSSSKKINSCYFHDKYIYIATDFGILVVDYHRKEIAETYFLNTIVYEATIFNGFLYAATQKGVQAASLTSNLLDPNSWSLSLPDVFTRIVSLPDKMLVMKNNEIYVLNTDGSLSFLKNASNFKIYKDHLLFMLESNEAERASLNLEITDHLPLGPEYLDRYTDMDNLSAESNTFWRINNLGIKIAKIIDGHMEYSEYIPFNNMRVDIPYRLVHDHDKLLVITPGPDYTLLHQGYISILENNRWKNIYPYETLGNLIDLHSIAISPADPNVFYVGSYRIGLFKFTDYKNDQLYNNTNSPLITFGTGNSYHISGLAFDKNNNLWMLNTVKQKDQSAIKILKPDDTWEELVYEEISNNTALDYLLIPKNSSTNTKFVLSVFNSISSNSHVFAFDENNTFSKSSDDKHKLLDPFFDQEGGKIDASTYLCIAEDKKGQIWIGTDKGPIVITNPANVFRDDFTATRIKVPRNDGTNLADYLLQTESINCIAVDGANRKWIGTQNTGLYLVSENGLETIHHFTADNSLLPSNTVLSLAIDPVSGEVFIGTEKGLVSYRSDANEGSEDYSNVYAFPNPVRPDYTGWITVTGLQENSLVKITDTAGNLFFQDISKGGQITWNGRGRNGERVKTGIYLVFASSEDGKSGVVTKIMVVN